MLPACVAWGRGRGAKTSSGGRGPRTPAWVGEAARRGAGPHPDRAGPACRGRLGARRAAARCRSGPGYRRAVSYSAGLPNRPPIRSRCREYRRERVACSMRSRPPGSGPAAVSVRRGAGAPARHRFRTTGLPSWSQWYWPMTEVTTGASTGALPQPRCHADASPANANVAVGSLAMEWRRTLPATSLGRRPTGGALPSPCGMHPTQAATPCAFPR